LEGIFVSGLTKLSSGALIAATRGCGIARSDDGGQTWRWINKGITQFEFWSVRSGQIKGHEVVLGRARRP